MGFLSRRAVLRAFIVISAIVIALTGLLSAYTPIREGVVKLFPWQPRPKPDTGEEFWDWDVASRFHAVTPNETSQHTDFCAGFPKYMLSSVQVVLKVGAGESTARTDSHTSSITRCIDNLLVVSDMDHELGPFLAQDVIADLPPSFFRETIDFIPYYAQHNGNLESRKEGWKLDKYKFLAMVERARKVNRLAQWYIFIEADTYVVWDNLFRLLDQFNPEEKIYFGSPSFGGIPEGETKGVAFANGGPGIVLSAAAIDAAIQREVGPHGGYTQPRFTAQWENFTRRDCCGDSILGWALWHNGVKLKGMWPHFNPHPLHGVPFHDFQWCQPVITMHKTFADDMVGLWQWEQQRNRSRPLLYADLAEYLGLGTFDRRDDWDNAEWGGSQPHAGSPAHQSFEACRDACHRDDGCFGHTYGARCNFVPTIRLGRARFPEVKNTEDKPHRYFAGWDLEKIADWRRKHPCETPMWMKPSLMRIF